MRLPRLLPLPALGLAASVLGLEIDREYGASSYQFLKLPLSPRVVAMGGAGTGDARTGADIDLNPAAAAEDSGLIFAGKGYPFREFGADASHITWIVPYRELRLMVNARHLGFDEIRGYDEMSRPTTAYSAHTFKGQLGLAGAWKGLGWGVTLNYAMNNIASANYAAALVNAGLRYDLPWGFSAGISGLNGDFWTSEAREQGRAAPFPPTALQAGLAYRRTVGSWQVAAAADARTRNDEKMTFPAGLEVGFRETLYARVGYPFAEPEPEISGGLGLNWNLFRFDYALQRHGTLSPGHYFSLGIRY